MLPSWNPVDLLRSPNWVGLAVYGAALGLVILVLLVVSQRGPEKTPGLRERTGPGERIPALPGVSAPDGQHIQHRIR